MDAAHRNFEIETERDVFLERFSVAQLRKPYTRKNLWVRIVHTEKIGLRFNVPNGLESAVSDIIDSAWEKPIDAHDWIQRQLIQAELRKVAIGIRKNPGKHRLRRELLKTELLPYQLDGIAFAVGAGRAVLAVDMGLGKMIQGIGVAELLARYTEMNRVLIVCPASLRSQWRNEINKFSDRTSQLITGLGEDRLEQHQADSFFTICNYEQVMRDLSAIEAVSWDLIILDEGQRIKNWDSKTSQIIRALKSQFALLLSGTPLENRLGELELGELELGELELGELELGELELGELETVIQFVDDHTLGPAYRFFHRYRTVDDRSKPTGYHRLDELRK